MGATKPQRLSLLKERPISLAVSLLSSGLFVAASVSMIPRIRAYYDGRTDLEQPRRYAFQIIEEPEFEYGGVPVTFEHLDAVRRVVEPGDTPPAADPATGSLRITYGDESLTLRDYVPGIAELPDLRRYENWLKVVRFVETTGMSVAEAQGKVDAGELRDRLALAVRIPPPGADEQTWGRVKRSEWRFETHELLAPDASLAAGTTEAARPGEQSDRAETGGTADTSIVSEAWVAPESERSFNRRVAAASRRGEPIPERRADELRQGTWQHDAAQLTMPDSRGYAPVFGADAFEAFGWTFPTAGVVAIVMPIGLAFLFAPRREDVEAKA